jgi:methylthioribose-1-phosphate isomerase
MKVDGKPMRTIWVEDDGAACGIIDQTRLPHRFETLRLSTAEDAAHAIRSMQVRGAPLIGATAAYAVWLAMRADASDEALERAYALLLATRPTAINLKWALDETVATLRNRPRAERAAAALKRAREIADEDVAINQSIGRHGLKLIEDIAAKKQSGGHLMQHGMVDLVIVGTDRTTANGDVCNKIGTYLKALAARDNNVPFYVAAPSPSIDFTVRDGVAEIPIEQRGPEEVSHIAGKTSDGRIETVQLTPDGSPVANYAFDVTPARLVTGLITERGVLAANRDALAKAFPERAS